MDNIKSLDHQQAIDKLKEMVEDITMCMFCTEVDEIPFETRPMATLQADAEGNLWFLSNRHSEKNSEIMDDSKVQLIYAKASDSHYLTVSGHAHVFYDRQKIDELWNPLIKAWFPEGKDDPNISIIKVVPHTAYYWDTKNGKMISLIKIAASALIGKTMDGSLEGTLSL